MAKYTAKEVEKLGRSELRRALGELGVSRNDTRMPSVDELKGLLEKQEGEDGKSSRRKPAAEPETEAAPSRTRRRPPETDKPAAEPEDEEPEDEEPEDEEKKPVRRRRGAAETEEAPARTRRRPEAGSAAEEPRRRGRRPAEGAKTDEEAGGADEDRDFRNDVIQRLDAIGQLLDKLSGEVGGRFTTMEKILNDLTGVVNEIADETLGPAE